MTTPITYYALSPDELEWMLREASRPEELVTAETASKILGCSPDFIRTVAKENKILPLGVPGHGKVKVYPINEIRKLFKPIQ